MTDLITRKDYMPGELTAQTHQQYYAQFVTPATLNWVSSFIGIDRLLASDDEHLNDIPLRSWERYSVSFNMSEAGRLCAKANGSGGVSLSDAVCVAKQAARQPIEGAS